MRRRRPAADGKASVPSAWAALLTVAALACSCCCRAFLLPSPSSSSAPSCHNRGRRAAAAAAAGWAPSSAPAAAQLERSMLVVGGSSRRRRPHTALAATPTTSSFPSPNTNTPPPSDWARFGEANAPTLLALRRAAMKGDVPAAEAAVAALEAQGVRPDLIALTHLMQAHAVCRSVEGTTAVLARMEREGLQPDLVPYSILLNLHADLADVAAAEKVFAEFSRLGMPRSTRAFTALMKAYMRARDPEGAEDVLFRMAASGQAPDIHAYTILLRSYAKVGDVRGAEDVMRRVLLAAEAATTEGENGGSGSGKGEGAGVERVFRVDVVIFNALLRLHVKKSIRLKRAGKGGSASADEGVASVLQRMEAFGVQPDDTTAALLASYRGEKRPVAAASRRMNASQEQPVAVAAVGGQQRQYRWQPPQVEDGLGGFGGGDGDGDAAAAAEAAAWERVRVLEAGLTARLEKGPDGVGEEAVLEVLRACVEAGDDVTARRVLALVPPPLATLNAHNLLLHLHARQGDAAGAERVLGQVLRQELSPSLTTYNTLLQAYVRRATRARRMAQEEYKRVLQVYESLRSSRDPALWPDSYTLTALLRCLQAKSQGGGLEALKDPYATLLRDVDVLLDAQRRSSQLYTALMGAAAAMGDRPTVEQAWVDAKQQLAVGCMPQRAFRFVENAYRRLTAGAPGRREDEAAISSSAGVEEAAPAQAQAAPAAGLRREAEVVVRR